MTISRCQKRTFLKLLRVELEDIGEHIAEQIEAEHERRERRKESAHVCAENVAVLQNEQNAIRNFEEIVDATDPDGFADLDALAAEVAREFEERIISGGFAPAACRFAERKLQRLRHYVAHDDTVPGHDSP